MKICWDNLENLKCRLKDTTFYDRRKKKRYYIVDGCENCNEEFLYLTNGRKNPKFCSHKCVGEGTREKVERTSLIKYGVLNPSQSYESRQKISNIHKGKIVLANTKKKISNSRKGKNCGKNNHNFGKNLSSEVKRKISKSKKEWYKYKYNIHPNWKGGYVNIPLYDTFAHQINWIEECRRNKKDPNILDVKCTYCGKWFVPSLNNINNRIQYLKGNSRYRGEQRFYCSTGCKHECPIYNQKKYPKGYKKATSREVQSELRQLVLKRDDYTCQKCSNTEHLHCHHIKPVVDDPIESADIDNCITYCKECHKEIHQKDGCRYNELKICI